MSNAPSAMPVPTPIPLPADFPIAWPDPAMAMATWQQDRQHVPEPIAPMSIWWNTHFAVGMSAAFASLKVPLQGQAARINCYYYLAIGPSVPPEMMEAAGAEAEPLLIAGMMNFWDRWENEWLPELKQTWADWAGHDLKGATDQQLSAIADRGVALYERIWQIHFELLAPAFVGMSGFTDMFTELFPGKTALDAYRLMQGFDNKSLQAGRALWAVSRVAKSDPALRQLIEATPSNELWAKLDGNPAAAAFLTELRAWLALYGKRSDTVLELSDPSWIEDPTPAFDNLKSYLAQDEGPDVNHAKLAGEREQLVAAAREAIKGHPDAVRGQFEGMLAAGQHCSQAQEDHNYWIDQRSLHEMRQLCLEFGRRLTDRGLLGQPSDVFMMDLDEAKAALAGGPGGGKNMKQVVAERQLDVEHWRTIAAPPMVGTDYGPPPDNPLMRALMRFFGGPTPEPRAANEIRGNPGSSGKVTGVARVILTIADAGRLQQGEILVTATTSPPWTPFFATAGGIVTDTGGAISHCAIVAREYGIPAVVGAAGATARIKDGQTIEVDGDEGAVRILS